MDIQVQFDHLFQTHYPKVYRLCKGYLQGDHDLASDAAQEVFVKVWEKRDTFRKEANISTWIYRITVNTCLLHLRAQNNRKTVRSEYPVTVAEPTGDEAFELRRQKMYACIQKLDPTGKIIILMVLEGEEYSAIASVIGTSEDTLRVRIHRIKKLLTQCVQS